MFNLSFDPTNFPANALSLCDFLGFESEDQIPISSFTISVGEEESVTTIVGKGKFKSALLLMYLLDIDRDSPQSSCMGNNGFKMNPDLIQITRDYFGEDFCNDALNNPETKHTTIRDLLSDEDVIVLIQRSQ